MDSQIRQNFHVENEAGLNKLINLELYASYTYQSMVSLKNHRYWVKSSKNVLDLNVKIEGVWGEFTFTIYFVLREQSIIWHWSTKIMLHFCGDILRSFICVISLGVILIVKTSGGKAIYPRKDKKLADENYVRRLLHIFSMCYGNS